MATPLEQYLYSNPPRTRRGAHYAPKRALPALLGAPLLFQLRFPLPELLTLLDVVARTHARGDVFQGVVEALARGGVSDLVLAARSTSTSR
jgi:hypothetical protein